MKTLRIPYRDGDYPVMIEKGLRHQCGRILDTLSVKKRSLLYIVTDSHVAPLYLDDVTKALREAGYACHFMIITAGEQSKNLVVYEQIMTDAMKKGLDRQSIIIALGGGVVGDIAGFVAATYMRGIPFFQFPTTLLAHDSSVGGKVAINHPLGKNMIGAFHQPSGVLYDTEMLETLPQREWNAGFAEIIKEAWIDGPSFFDWIIENKTKLMSHSQAVIDEAIYRGIHVKKRIVAEDERELGIRAVLNFGHTVGHAIEKMTGYTRYLHGEAVSIGLVAACKVSERCYGVTNISSRMTELLVSFHLPVAIPSDLEISQIIETMKRDKKAKNNSIVMVLTKGAGDVHLVDHVNQDLIYSVLDSMVV